MTVKQLKVLLRGIPDHVQIEANINGQYGNIWGPEYTKESKEIDNEKFELETCTFFVDYN